MIHAWENFYLLVGTAGGALVGLMFVVATLTAGRERSSALRGARLYMTPVVVVFVVTLVLSALASTPRLDDGRFGWEAAACGAAGLLYAAGICVGLVRTEASEPPHWSDFWCYGVAPAVFYLLLAGAGAALAAGARQGLEAVAGAVMLLLLIGIRNAWDLVTWLAPAQDKATGG